MNCQDCQNALCDSMDTAENATFGLAVEQHLTECAACRDFHAAWPVVEVQLENRFANIPLPPNFKTSLFAKLVALEPRLTPADLAARRAELEREYREAAALLNRRYLVPQLFHGILRVAGLTAGWSLIGLVLAGIVLSLPFIDSVVSSSAAAMTMQIVCSTIGLGAGIISLRRSLRHSLRSMLPSLFRRLAAS